MKISLRSSLATTVLLILISARAHAVPFSPDHHPAPAPPQPHKPSDPPKAPELDPRIAVPACLLLAGALILLPKRRGQQG
jgi:hypothetical protein